MDCKKTCILFSEVDRGLGHEKNILLYIYIYIYIYILFFFKGTVDNDLN